MRRGLKHRDRAACRLLSEAASNRSPMRRGLKPELPAHRRLKPERFKPIPDEEGTETVLAEAARSLKK